MTHDRQNQHSVADAHFGIPVNESPGIQQVTDRVEYLCQGLENTVHGVTMWEVSLEQKDQYEIIVHISHEIPHCSNIGIAQLAVDHIQAEILKDVVGDDIEPQKYDMW